MNREYVLTQLKTFICAELLKDVAYPLTEDEPLISGGVISSFYLVQIALFIENEFGVHIPDAELTVENLDTLAQMTERILKEQGS